VNSSHGRVESWHSETRKETTSPWISRHQHARFSGNYDTNLRANPHRSRWLPGEWNKPTGNISIVQDMTQCEIKAQRTLINALVTDQRATQVANSKHASPSQRYRASPMILHEAEDTHHLQKRIKQKWDKLKLILDHSNFLKWKQAIRSELSMCSTSGYFAYQGTNASI
jgi:hypothetical protein